MKHILLLTALIGALVSCSSVVADAAGDITVVDPYVRAIPPMVPTSAAYLGLKNSSNIDHKLISAASPAAEIVELHEHIHADGMMQMRQLDEIVIPANSKTVLQPGGYHIMLIRLISPIKHGDNIALTLEFADGSQKQLSVPVREPQLNIER